VALGIILGVVFVYSGWLKLRESWVVFAITIDAYGVLPQWAVVFIARTLPWGELTLGLLLLSSRWRRTSSAIAAVLLLSFFSLLVYTYARGLDIDCGCFGPSGDPISPKTLARDGILATAALALVFLSFRRPAPVTADPPPEN
jgi:uncharacterized membrane protein YphA (DoxX/SURF4 family)